MLEFILFSFLFGLIAVGIFILQSNQNEQIKNQKAMIEMLRDIRAKNNM